MNPTKGNEPNETKPVVPLGLRLLRAIGIRWGTVREFCHGRIPQSDADFLVDCRIKPGADEAIIALAVRRSVAAVGTVDATYIYANDSYPGTLEGLPVWDSMDWLALAMSLEQQLCMKISNEEFEQILGDLHEVLTVDRLVHRTIQVVVCRASTPHLTRSADKVELLTVEDAFEIIGRGIVVKPDFPRPIGWQNRSESVEIHLPGGELLTLEAKFLQTISKYADPERVPIEQRGWRVTALFPNASKDRLPVGSKVMVSTDLRIAIIGHSDT